MSFWDKINKRKKSVYVLSLDIGTEVVKALVSYVDYGDNKITNVGIGKSKQKPGSIFGGKVLDTDNVIDACKEAADQAMRMSGVRPTEVIIGLSGNTIKVCTSVLDIERSDYGGKIEMNELRSIIAKAHLSAIEDINRNLSKREKQEGIRLISSDVSDFVIDGYRIINPLNFKGNHIKVSMSSSYILASDFVVLEKIVESLHMKLMKVSYGPYAVLKAIGGRDVFGFNAIMLDIGGNITDVVMVKNGSIENANMFTVGGRVFTKRLSHNFKINEDQAEDLKLRYSFGQIDENDSGRIGRILEQDINLWLSGVGVSLEVHSKNSLLPSQFMIFGGGSKLPGLVASLNSLKEDDLSFSGGLKLDFVLLDDIPNNLNKIESMDDSQDITIVCLAHLCFDYADGEDMPNRILEQLVLNK